MQPNPERAGQVEAGVRMGLLVTDVAYLMGLSRTSIYKTAAAAGLDLPVRPTRTPTREGWEALIAEHGLDTLKLAGVLGLRRFYIKEQLEKHELLECE